MCIRDRIIQREGSNRIIIELPGEKDPQKAIDTIGKTAVLQDVYKRQEYEQVRRVQYP